ncbi:MAG: ribonuclease HII [Gammaproteobacteria bacterium]
MPPPSSTKPFSPDLLQGVGGVDEVGRGPLAGPVVAAAVVLAPGQTIDGVKDSKQLTPRRREELSVKIREQALDWALGRCSCAEIDELNILNASLLAMRRAIEALRHMPGHLRIDGNRAPELDNFSGEVETLVGGDRLCIAIGAASILAKVARDAEMSLLAQRFPGYGFDRHKGYPTVAHREALMQLGPCDEHRRSFRPVRLAMASLPEPSGR